MNRTCIYCLVAASLTVGAALGQPACRSGPCREVTHDVSTHNMVSGTLVTQISNSTSSIVAQPPSWGF